MFISLRFLLGASEGPFGSAGVKLLRASISRSTKRPVRLQFFRQELHSEGRSLAPSWAILSLHLAGDLP